MTKSKFEFAQPQVEYCGYSVSNEGWTVDPAKISALRSFPVPANRTDLRSFFGLVQQFADFSSSISKNAQALRPLLKEHNRFVWDSTHQEAFEATRKELCQPPILTFYNPTADLRVETDASRVGGLGFVLYQKHDDSWQLLQCGSRFLTDAETRYAMIELELLAIVWALKKCELYLAGRRFDLITDHRPLIPILNTYTLSQVENPRIVRLLLKIRSFVFTASWRKGSEHKVADAFSRAPVEKPSKEDEYGEEDAVGSVAVRGVNLLGEETKNSLQLEELKNHCNLDSQFRELEKVIIEGFPATQSELHVSLRPFWSVKEHLSVENGVILMGCRLYIPQSLRMRVMSDRHASHQGIERTKRRARQIVYWPNINNDIRNVVLSCEKCVAYLPSQQAVPLIQVEVPKLPFQSVATDIFTHSGREYLILTDRTSGWTCISDTGRSTSSEDVIKVLRSWFPYVGVPSILTSDGGPQYKSKKFRVFCKRWYIKHEMSSPYYHQSNGCAEAAVKTTKRLIQKCSNRGGLDLEAFHKGLLELRNTPNNTGRSPAEILFGRPLSSFVYASAKSFSPDWRVKAEEADLRAENMRKGSV